MKLEITIAKREEYIKAWQEMYKRNKTGFNLPIFDGVNPALNKKPLGTETDNFSSIAYAVSSENEKIPVGIFSFVVTPSKVIGKQFVVDPNYQGNGIGKALVLSLEKELIKNGFEVYYIGCSKMSAGIMKSFGQIPYSSDEQHDMYKFNINLKRKDFKNQYKKFITDKKIKIKHI